MRRSSDKKNNSQQKSKSLVTPGLEENKSPVQASISDREINSPLTDTNVHNFEPVNHTANHTTNSSPMEISSLSLPMSYEGHSSNESIKSFNLSDGASGPLNLSHRDIRLDNISIKDEISDKFSDKTITSDQIDEISSSIDDITDDFDLDDYGDQDLSIMLVDPNLPGGLFINGGQPTLALAHPFHGPVKDTVQHRLECAQFSNIDIIIGRLQFRCYDAVMRRRSGYFHKNTLKVVSLPESEVTPFAFINAYNMLLGKMSYLKIDDIFELFKAAKFLDIKYLIDHCWVQFDSYYMEGNAFLCAKRASAYGLTEIEQLLYTRVSRSFLTIVGTINFLEMECSETCAILGSNSVGVNTEIEVFFTGILWLSHDWDIRKQSLPEIMGCVRFGLIPSWVMILMQKLNLGLTTERVINHPFVLNKMQEGITYDNVRKLFSAEPQNCAEMIEKYKVSPPAPRQWVYDPQCLYHHLQECGNKHMIGISIGDFMNYLEQLQQSPLDYPETIRYIQDVDNYESCRCGWKEGSTGTTPSVPE